MHFESRFRAFAKTMSWRLLGTFGTMLLVFLFSRRLDIAAAVGGVEIFLKLILYYLHERMWDKVPIGRYSATPVVVWFTGLPCSGKTTLADRMVEELKNSGHKVERLDGDAVRTLFPQIGFDRAARHEHIQRMGYLASLLEKHGISVIASFVSPYRESRDFARKACKNFIEVYVSTPLEICEQRDVKGMYRKAREGQLRNFTGVDDVYEPPLNPEIEINTVSKSIDDCMRELRARIGSRARKSQANGAIA